MSNISNLAEQLQSVNEEIGSLNNKLKIQQVLKAQLQDEIMKELDNLGLSKATTKTGTVYVSERIVASVDDWEEVYKYIDEHKAFHLLTRKILDSAYREILEMQQQIPGIKPFHKKTIGLRKE